LCFFFSLLAPGAVIPMTTIIHNKIQPYSHQDCFRDKCKQKYQIDFLKTIVYYCVCHGYQGQHGWQFGIVQLVQWSITLST
jgi:hypothetical protein